LVHVLGVVAEAPGDLDGVQLAEGEVDDGRVAFLDQVVGLAEAHGLRRGKNSDRA